MIRSDGFWDIAQEQLVDNLIDRILEIFRNLFVLHATIIH